MKRFNSALVGNIFFLPILAAALLFVQLPADATPERIAILPFEIHSKTDLAYMGHGIHQMLASRLSWKDRVEIVDPQEPYLANTAMAQAALTLKADYVLSGSVTEFAGAFSVDTTVFKAQTQTIQTFFGQAATVDEIIPQLDILAAKINHSLFDRKTAALESVTPAAPDAATFNIRENPEKLMPKALTLGDEASRDRPFWKFWGSDDPRPEQTDNTPFWKFWKKDSPKTYDGAESDESFETGTAEPAPNEIPEGEKEDRPFWKFW